MYCSNDLDNGRQRTLSNFADQLEEAVNTLESCGLTTGILLSSKSLLTVSLLSSKEKLSGEMADLIKFSKRKARCYIWGRQH